VNARVISLAERVVRGTDRQNPADAVLRLELKSQHGLTLQETAEVSRAVFSFFRWRGWLDDRQILSDQIRRAVELADRFANDPDTFPNDELVARVVPPWILKEIEFTPGFARALQTEPTLWLRARPGQGLALAQQLGCCRPFGAGSLGDALAYNGIEDLFRSREFHAGSFELQDISSQAVGLVCASVPGETWWDACAGEGGKLLHLSDLMTNKGLIWASDRAEWRLRRLRRRAARAHVYNYRAALWDGGPKLPTKTRFDGVLLDAPCSGTGTWQRNPHARWTLTSADVEELAGLQLRLLINAAAALKPGGRLVYSVCSLTQSETIGVGDLFQSRCSEFEPLELVNPLNPNAPATARLLLRPPEVDGNGMFIMAWARRR
jgi:16S rRNA (cytosine967-C5)-methyltransferase